MYPSQINHQIPNNSPQNSPQVQVQRQQQQPTSQDSISVQGIPSVTLQDNHLLIGNSQSSMFLKISSLRVPSLISHFNLGSTRSYTRLKVLGDGSFGTVWLCDWHGILPPNTPLSPMQCGAGARPEWTGKRLVAVKRMKKKWEGGWDECQKLKELEVRFIPLFQTCCHFTRVFVPVPTRNTLSPKCYPFIRLLSSPGFKRTLFCF